MSGQAWRKMAFISPDRVGGQDLVAKVLQQHLANLKCQFVVAHTENFLVASETIIASLSLPRGSR